MNRQKSHFFNYFLWKNKRIYKAKNHKSIKPHGGGWFNWELKILGLFLVSISFINLVFSNSTFAAYVPPTLSASVDNMNLQINGNQVINSVSQTKEIPLSLTVNTNNKTGYTITLNSETDENALVNTNSAVNAKIDSIFSASVLNNFSNNTWGVKFGSNSAFSPIPKLTSPANIAQTTTKTNGNETTDVKLGMKLGSNLESGNYKNKLIFSILTNQYDPIAEMTSGPNFNTKLKSLETATNKIEHFKKSTTAPAATMNAVNVEAPESDYEIKLWLDPSDKTAYYYTEPEKVYLGWESGGMFERSEYGDDRDKIKGIKDLDLSNFDTSKVVNMAGMFCGMSSLTSLDLSNFDTSKVVNMAGMFCGMSSLTSLDLSNFYTSNVTGMNSMFKGMSSLTSIDLSHFNTSKVGNMDYMFEDMSSLTSIDISNFDTFRVAHMDGMFANMSSLISLNLPSFNTFTYYVDMERMFSGVSSLTHLDLSHFNTSTARNMGMMFSNMRSLTSLNLSNFNTSNATNMRGMFSHMSSLTSLDLSSFNTSNVTDMEGMFYNASSLTSLDLSNLNTSKVEDMVGMFRGMSSLTSLKLSNFNTSKVKDMRMMFYNVRSLTSLDLSSFDTSNVEDMYAMFANMFSLTSIDLSNFDTSNVKTMEYMFYLENENASRDQLGTIYVKNDFDITKLQDYSNIFTNRKKLRGGAGSYLSDPSTADKSWLRIDDPSHGRPGYFTRKP